MNGVDKPSERLGAGGGQIEYTPAADLLNDEIYMSYQTRSVVRAVICRTGLIPTAR